MAKKYGQYLVVEGSKLKLKTPHNGIGEYDIHCTYVIHLPTMKIKGRYNKDHLAHECAKFLDKTDRDKATEAMDRILCGEE